MDKTYTYKNKNQIKTKDIYDPLLLVILYIMDFCIASLLLVSLFGNPHWFCTSTVMGWFIFRFWVHIILKDFVWRGIQDRRIEAEWEETNAERIKEKRTNEINVAKKLMEEDDFESLEEALEIFHQWGVTEHTQYIEIKIAKESERLFDFETPLSIYLKYSLHEEAARIRKLQAEQGSVKVDQTVVQGDQITKTEIKDSVVSKSNVGGGSSKMQELEKLTEMKKEGLIDDDEFKQMKKEILGK